MESATVKSATAARRSGGSYERGSSNPNGQSNQELSEHL
jgi:hypothetical protein